MDYNHPDLYDSILRDQNGDPVGYNSIELGQSFDDDCMHGTHIAGIVAAQTNNELGIASLGGNNGLVKIMPVKMATRYGNVAEASLILDGMVWAVNHPTYPADVVNMSWHFNWWTGITEEQMQDFFTESTDNLNCAFIAAAGNHGLNLEGLTPPSMDNVFAVAASNRDRSRALYSNGGEVIDITAPGGTVSSSIQYAHNPDGILSTLPSNEDYEWHYSNQLPGDYAYNYQFGAWIEGGVPTPYYDFAAGTSMAAPFVSSTVALLKAKYYTELQTGEKDINDLFEIIKLSASEGNFTIINEDLMGAGILDAGAALQNQFPFHTLENAGFVKSHLVVSDTDNDGNDEMVVISSYLESTGLSLLHYYNQGWESQMIYQPVDMTPAIGDINGDGNKEIIVGSTNGWIEVFDNELNQLYNLFIVNESIDFTAVMEDVTGDGQLDLILSTNPSVDWQDDSVINIVDFSTTEPTIYSFHEEGRRICNSISVVNIDSDPQKEIIVPSVNSDGTDGDIRIYEFLENNEIDLQEIITFPSQVSNISAPVIADLNEDGSVEIITSYLSGTPQTVSVSYYEFLNTTWTSVDEYLPSDIDNMPEITIGNFIPNHAGLEFALSKNSSASYSAIIYGYEGLLISKDVDNEIVQTLFIDYNNNETQDLIIFTKNSTNYFPELGSEDQLLRNQNFSSNYKSVALGKLENENNESLYYISENGKIFSMPFNYSNTSVNEHTQYRNNARNTGSYYQPLPELITSSIYIKHDVIISKNTSIDPRYRIGLYVDEGVEIRFERDKSLIVSNTFEINGTEQNPVNIHGLCHNDIISFWDRIKIDDKASSNINFANISNASIGLFYKGAGKADIHKSNISNNQYGIIQYGSSVNYSNNSININEEHGITALHGSGFIGGPANLMSIELGKNEIIGSRNGLFPDSSSKLYLSEGHNNVDNDEYNILLYNDQYISAEENWWGSSLSSDILDKFNFPSLIDFSPWDIESNTMWYERYRDNTDNPFILGLELMEEQNYIDAITSFHSVLNDSIETNEDFLSIYKLYLCHLQLDNIEEMESYIYTKLEQDVSEELEAALLGNLALINRSIGNFDDAIQYYESIILNDPSYEDYCYAIIDIGDTYLEAEGRASVSLPEFIPVSKDLHQKKSYELIESILTGNKVTESEVPEHSAILNNNYPNPFNPTTTISFNILNDSTVKLEIFNIKGQKVKTIMDDFKLAGSHKVIWQGRNSANKSVASGVYFYKLNVDGKTIAVKKCLMLK